MAIFSSIAALGTSVIGTVFGAKVTGVLAFGVGLLSQTAIGAALNALAPKPPKPVASGYRVNSRGSALDQQIIYGKTRVGGVLVYEESVEGVVDTAVDNQFLLQAYVHAGHAIDGYDEVFIDGRKVTEWTLATNTDTPPLPADIIDKPSDVANGTSLVPYKLCSVNVDGTVNTGDCITRYSMASNGENRRVNYLVFRFYDGTQTTADAGFVAEPGSNWTSSHKLQGLPYMALTMGYDQKVFPRGVPEILCGIRGKKVFDPRSSTTTWSDNPALCLRDYLTSDYGLGEISANIDDTLFSSQANVCDETVDGETKYTCNGAFLTSQTPFDMLNDILTSMGGLLWYSQGKWRVKAAKWSAPSVSLNEDDLLSPISVKTRHSRRENFNIVRGTFTGPETGYQPTDYPQVTNITDTETEVSAGSFVIGDVYKIETWGTTNWNLAAGTSGVTYNIGDYFTAANAGSGTGTALETTNAYLDTDNGMESVLNFNLPFTDTSKEARRLARILLERNRQQLTISAVFGLKAFQLQVGDTVSLSVDRFGWEDKPFEVTAWSFGISEDMNLETQLTLREISEGVFDNLDDGALLEADNTSLNDPFFVPDLSLTVSNTVKIIDNKPSRVITFNSSVSDNNLLVDKVRYFYKLSSESEYKFLAEGGLGDLTIIDFAPGTYDFRAVPVSQIGSVGEFVTETNFTFAGPIVNRFGQTYNGAFETLDFSGWVEEGYFNTAEVLARDTSSSVILEKTCPFEAMARFDEADGLNPSDDLLVRVTGLLDGYIFLSWDSLIPVRPNDQVSLSWLQGEVDQVGFEDFPIQTYYEYYDEQQNRLFESTPVTSVLAGRYYKIATAGSFDWTTVGAPNSLVGTEFRASATSSLVASSAEAYTEVFDLLWANLTTLNPDEWTLLQGNVTIPDGAYYCKPRFVVIDSSGTNTPGYITGVKFFISEPTSLLSEHSVTEGSKTSVSTTNLPTDGVESVVATVAIQVPELFNQTENGQTLEVYSNATGNIDFTGSATSITMRLYVDGVRVASQVYRADSGFNLSSINPINSGTLNVELRALSPDVSEVTITEATVIGLVLKR